jgi:hypothetical protein
VLNTVECCIENAREHSVTAKRSRTIPDYDIDRGVGGIYFIETPKLPLGKVGYTTDIHQRKP